MKRSATWWAAAVLACGACSAPPSRTVDTPDSSTQDTTPDPRACGDAVCTGDQSCVSVPGEAGTLQCVEPGTCAVAPKSGRDLFAEALSAVGLDRCTVRMGIDVLRAFRLDGDPFRLKHAATAFDAPLAWPSIADRMAQAIPSPADIDAVSHGLREASARLDRPIDAAPLEASVDPSRPLAAEIERLWSLWQGQTPSTLEADAADVPLELQTRLVPVIQAIAAAAGVRDRVFRGQDLTLLARLAPSQILPVPEVGSLDLTNPANRTLLASKFDWKALHAAALRVSLAVEGARLADFAGRTGVGFDVNTPVGRVVITDAGTQVHTDGAPIALLLDLGGDDTYATAVGAADGIRQAVGVAIELGGNDTYSYIESPAPGDEGRLPSDGAGRYAAGDPAQGQTVRTLSEVPRQGAGRCGIGLLWDHAGNDRYRSLVQSQGFGAMGVGVLWDGGGDDTYEAEAASQGAGLFGIGLLMDAGGNDTRRIYAFGQGFGGVLGYGALVDGAGDDQYLADVGDPAKGGDPLYLSAQLPNRGNSSFVQGAGFGSRPASASGGVGLLVDRGAGADHYRASVFAQGTGYWFGSGVLDDGGGDDLYEALWYGSGASAHFAFSSLRDRGGNDRHGSEEIRAVATSVGVGHDFSTSVLWDDAGNDVYLAPGLGLGAGNANGWGLFVDLAGDDRYDAAGGPSLGGYAEASNEPFRAARPTVGVVIDAGGDDRYIHGDVAVSDAANALWRTPRDPKAPLAAGVRLDADAGSVLIVP